jgi:hypothetical protein
MSSHNTCLVFHTVSTLISTESIICITSGHLFEIFCLPQWNVIVFHVYCQDEHALNLLNFMNTYEKHLSNFLMLL